MRSGSCPYGKESAGGCFDSRDFVFGGTDHLRATLGGYLLIATATLQHHEDILMTKAEKKKLKEIASRLTHKLPLINTGRWWRNECAEGCATCELLKAIK